MAFGKRKKPPKKYVADRSKHAKHFIKVHETNRSAKRSMTGAKKAVDKWVDLLFK